MADQPEIKIDPAERAREVFGSDDVVRRMKEIKDLVRQTSTETGTIKVDMRPIFVTVVTAALVWGKDPREVLTADVYGKVMDLMNMFFVDK